MKAFLRKNSEFLVDYSLFFYDFSQTICLSKNGSNIEFFVLLCYTICSMSKTNLIHARSCVYNVNYHIVWSVKYRRKVLDSVIEKRLKEILLNVAKEKGFTIVKMEVGEMDHIHLFVTSHPKLSISYIVKMMKGISGRLLMKEFPNLSSKLWNGELWNPSYYVETIGSVSEENIKRYIQNQEKE